MRLAVTGHRGLPPATIELVDEAIRARLARCASRDKLVGLSCLADGADQVFAWAVLDAGGRLEVIVPAAAYRDDLPEDARAPYDELLLAASAVNRLAYAESTAQAHMAASEVMLGSADHLFAVWDGLPARGFGGTADVVATARSRSVPITVIWPEGATRDQPG
jgi:hypothetical protein